jgi:ketosteroid isomerase-like protein
MRLSRLFVISLMMLSAATGRAQDGANAQAVLPVLACFTDSWNSHDMRSFGQCFAPDADFVNVTGQWWKGRAALEKNHAYLHGTIDVNDTAGVTLLARSHGIFKNSTLSFTSRESRFARPDLAIVHASWTMTGDARTAEPRTGLMTLVVANNDGNWRIVAVHNVEIARRVS